MRNLKGDPNAVAVLLTRAEIQTLGHVLDVYRDVMATHIRTADVPRLREQFNRQLDEAEALSTVLNQYEG